MNPVEFTKILQLPANLAHWEMDQVLIISLSDSRSVWKILIIPDDQITNPIINTVIDNVSACFIDIVIHRIYFVSEQGKPDTSWSL